MSWRFDLANEIGGRTEQQDRAEVLAAPNRSDDHLVVLADGVGGQRHGAMAAQAVIDTAKRELSVAPVADPKQFLTDLCKKAHERIEEIGRQTETSPASTCAILYVRDAEAYWAHVGDSRLYHFGGDGLLFRTRDLSVAELLNGEGTPESAARNAELKGSRLYMCLGGKNELEPEFGATAVGKNDWFMLCSDGFWDQVETEEVARALAARPMKRSSAADLVALAAQRGGTDGDNVSLVLAIHEHSRLKSLWRRLFPFGIRFRR